MSIYSEWMLAKQAEVDAVAHRRALEDEMIRQLELTPFEGTETFGVENYKVKVTGRMTRKIDSDKLQQIAAEYGLTAHLAKLFRWKPEINMTVWKQANEIITTPLLGAITTTPGRFTFTITEEKE